MQKFFAQNIAALNAAGNATDINVAKRAIDALRSAAADKGYYTVGVVVPVSVVRGLLRGLVRQAGFTVMQDGAFYTARSTATK